MNMVRPLARVLVLLIAVISVLAWSATTLLGTTEVHALLHDALGYQTLVSSSAPFDEWLAAYRETVRQVARDLPNLSLIGTQWRLATNADLISWGAVLYETATDTFYTAPVRHDIPIADRTGGGSELAPNCPAHPTGH